MLIHPHCPCSRATLRELSRILARAGEAVSAHVIFVGDGDDDTGADAGRVDADLRRAALAIPGVVVHDDARGEEARRFGVATSGQVVLYDPEGVEAFHGGITPARGHEGDNAGEHEVLERLLHDARGTATAPVFGCALAGEPR